MNVRERQAEIIRILMGRKNETVPRLAMELGVSKNTVYRDIDSLSLDYPIVTQQGNCGGVTLMDWRHPHKNLFSKEQQRVLTELIFVADKHQSEVLLGLINAYGTKRPEGGETDK
jgi:predicted DNA-binding transcriptional regulator YafY